MTYLLLACLLSATQPSPDIAGQRTDSSSLAELSQRARNNRAACGPLSVWYVLDRMGKRTDADELVASARPGKDGTPIVRLLELLSEHDCPGRAVSTRRARLGLLPVPSILIVGKGNHCVVYDGLDKAQQRARIFEPTNTNVRWVELKRLQKEWTGEAIIFGQPRPSFPSLIAVSVFVMSVIAAPVACFAFRRGSGRRRVRSGFTLIELLIAMGIIGILVAVALPAIQQAREAGRTAHCRSNLRQIGIALHDYQAQFHVFPPAVAWKPAGEPLGRSIAAPGSIDRISLGLATRLKPDRVYANWVMTLLPYLGEEGLYDAFDLTKPVGDDVNERARATEMPLMKCPTDPWNAPGNHFQRAGLTAADRGYARGNYAINGGTNRRCLTRLSIRGIKCPDGVDVNGTDLRKDTSKVWGNGVAGVNRSMHASEFSSGLSKTIFIEEIRAGLHPLDRRGVWSLGFPGSSITACHGLYGNKGPNMGKDAIQGCSETAAYVPDLEQQGMPCLRSKTDPRLEISERATARSMHVGGVNVLMADGSVQYLANTINARLWHNLHDRERRAPIDF